MFESTWLNRFRISATLAPHPLTPPSISNALFSLEAIRMSVFNVSAKYCLSSSSLSLSFDSTYLFHVKARWSHSRVPFAAVVSHAEKPSHEKDFRAQISSTENVLIRDAILAPVAKQ